MTRSFLPAALALTLAVVAPAADPADALTGDWAIVSVSRDGKDDPALKGGVRTHGGDKYTVTPPAGSSVPKVEGTFAVDAGKSPMHYDMKPATGRYKGKTLLGIAKLDGDTLIVAFSESGDRPKALDSAPGVVVAVHKKAK